MHLRINAYFRVCRRPGRAVLIAAQHSVKVHSFHYPPRRTLRSGGANVLSLSNNTRREKGDGGDANNYRMSLSIHADRRRPG